VSEVPRCGAVRFSTAVRVGDTVRRQPGREFVRELLGFLERSGWGGAPRFLGVDEQGREILTFVDGYVPWQEGGAPGASGGYGRGQPGPGGRTRPRVPRPHRGHPRWPGTPRW